MFLLCFYVVLFLSIEWIGLSMSQTKHVTSRSQMRLIILNSLRGEETFVYLKPECQSGERTHKPRFSRLASLTIARAPRPFSVWNARTKYGILLPTRLAQPVTWRDQPITTVIYLLFKLGSEILYLGRMRLYYELLWTIRINKFTMWTFIIL